MSDVTDTVRALVPVVILAAAASLGVDVPHARPSHPEVQHWTNHHFAPAIEPQGPDGPQDTAITPGTGSLFTSHAGGRSTSTSHLS